MADEVDGRRNILPIPIGINLLPGSSGVLTPEEGIIRIAPRLAARSGCASSAHLAVEGPGWSFTSQYFHTRFARYQVVFSAPPDEVAVVLKNLQQAGLIGTQHVMHGAMAADVRIPTVINEQRLGVQTGFWQKAREKETKSVCAARSRLGVRAAGLPMWPMTSPRH